MNLYARGLPLRPSEVVAMIISLQVAISVLAAFTFLQSVDSKNTSTYTRIRKYLNSVPAIDTHDHLFPLDIMRGKDKTDRGEGMTLHSIWSASYFTRNNQLTPWPSSGHFEEWWAKAKYDFANAHAESFY